MNNNKNYKYEIKDYVEVVNPHDGYGEYTGRRGVIVTRHFDADYMTAYEILFDGYDDVDKYVWFEEEIEYCIASENELLNLLS